ncbi:peptidase S8/S53 domain-containing protein [Lactarius quietus]|nr:peptidase S8/S53 domain-containing protein [Lactarius quietus]
MRYYCHGIFILSVLAAVLLGSLAKSPSSTWEDKRTKHSWNAVPTNWESLGRPPLSTTIDLYISLKPQSENALIDVLYNVSTPGHPVYGEHLSKEQVAELVAPHPRTLKLVNSWLKNNGIPSSSVTTQGGNTLMLKAVPVSKANTLLDATYQLYRHVESHETIIRTVGYGLPAALREHVRTVVPTTAFVPSLKHLQIPHNLSGGAESGLVKPALGKPTTMLSNRDDVDYVDPQILRQTYDTVLYIPAMRTGDENMVALVGNVGDYPSQADLTVFMEKYRADAVTASFVVTEVNPGPPDGQPNTEPDARIQYLEAFVFPIAVVDYVTGRGLSGTDDWFMAWLRYLLDQAYIPRTIAGTFSFDEDTLPSEYADEACLLFARLGARGVTFLFASGDHGVGAGDCMNRQGLLQFRPTFPATCPYVTAVGGTAGLSPTGLSPEYGTKSSGGGFSNYFDRRDYQEEVVNAYLEKLGNRNRRLFNPFGRGVPDLSAQAINFKVVVNGNDQYSSGTGTATAVVAGIVALLYDLRILHGDNAMGWLNPWLYGSGSMGFNDITQGSNEGCATEGLGFPALEGWDPVTGFGTPDFAKMQQWQPIGPYYPWGAPHQGKTVRASQVKH